jgi:hypothetical protein
LTSPCPEGRGLRRSPAGVPVSRPAARPGKLPGRSDAGSAGKRRQPGGSDVDRGVDIPVMPGTAMRALPLTDMQRQARRQPPAPRARLGRRIPAIDHDKVPPVPVALVLQHDPQLPPGRVGDGAGQVMVADQVPHAQVLDHDRLVIADEPGRELAQEISAAVGDPGMDTARHAEGRLRRVLPGLKTGVSTAQRR